LKRDGALHGRIPTRNFGRDLGPAFETGKNRPEKTDSF